jgi:Co/Zn/Cd efflux system component
MMMMMSSNMSAIRVLTQRNTDVVAGVPPQILYQVTMVAARRANSSLLKANAWHHRSDALSSIIALLGIAAAQAGQSPYWDPVAAAVVSAMIVRTTLHAHDTTHTHDLMRTLRRCEWGGAWCGRAWAN